jgi:hypothetical protein
MVPVHLKVADRLNALSRRERDIILIAAAAAMQLIFLAAAWRDGHFGFPLDDAWIYQTYARNLVRDGQWAFVPGRPSTGSTSILWALLVVPGQVLPLDPRIWTQLIGFGSLAGLALGADRFFDDVPAGVALALGLAVAVEWHLVWAAASGMETAFFAALVLWFWLWFRRHDPARVGHRWQDGLLTGIWGGVLMLARPEGVAVLGVAGLVGVAAPGRIAERLKWGMAAALGFLLLFVPFLGFNVAVSGSIWPNTFYAKQTEYAVLWTRPYLLRLLGQASVSLVGAQILLLPGLVIEGWHRLRERAGYADIGALGWIVLHWALYAARLPVTYQHGRYAIPVIPLLLLYGIRGAIRFARSQTRHPVGRITASVWLLSAIVTLPVFGVMLGAPAYGEDVSFIEREMVATARWVADNVPEDAVIAAHDIGALGYFAPHPLLDLAGLISPDVIPVMHDPAGLAAFIVEGDSDYLIVFPGWSEAYARLVASPVFVPVWSADEQPGYSEESQLGPMTVYRVDAALDEME